jgi:carbon storage regulator CsrA
MLVLSRKKDETIILKGPNMEDIKITVVRIDNRNKVRIGIEAVKDITVLRSELAESGEQMCEGKPARPKAGKTSLDDLEALT